ncbi:MAG: hypothetical protein KVP17_005087 [Porospora cf. gigantea B]|uniref:uncharacterized protein n=2 Tax=Porospora cf. gigantea B TaxID=2853592 RepID=UPI0035718B2D|nr:MAG: hypothetical protein KVP17_005087 [Porospora cf. gigantea B]
MSARTSISVLSSGSTTSNNVDRDLSARTSISVLSSGSTTSDNVDRDLQLNTLPWWKNRYLRTVIVYIGILFTASLYSSWQPMYYMLVDSGAYSWLCNTDSVILEDGSCHEQYAVLNQQYQVGSNLAYIVGVLAGFLLDVVGPRWCALTGVFCVVIGYAMMALSSQHLQLYWPAWILVGSAENLIGFVGFVPGDFFPGYQQTFITICISAQILSSSGPPIMWSLIKHGTSFRSVWSVYLLCLALPAGLLMVLASPRNNKMKALEVEHYVAISHQDDVAKEADTKDTSAIMRNKRYWKHFGSLLLKPELLVFTLWYAVMVLGFNFYSSGIIAQSGQAVAEFVGVLGPFRAFVGPVIGLASDYFGMTLVSTGLCFTGAFFYSIALVPTQAAQYTSACAYLVGRSFVFATKYLFVQQFYPQVHFGKLSGVMSLVGGLLGFLNALLVTVSLPTTTMYAIWGTVLGLMSIPIIWIHFRARKLRNVSVFEESEIVNIAAEEC